MDLELARSGWTIFTVSGPKATSCTVPTMGGEAMTVDIMRMQEFSVVSRSQFQTNVGSLNVASVYAIFRVPNISNELSVIQ